MNFAKYEIEFKDQASMLQLAYYFSGSWKSEFENISEKTKQNMFRDLMIIKNF